MSWKSIVTAGLVCLLASPVFALTAPTLGVVSTAGTAANGHLDANGNWLWTVNVTPTYGDVPDASGTPIAAELGFNAGVVTGLGGTPSTGQGNILSAVRNPASGTGSFDTINPGNVVYSSWQTAGNGLLDANSNNKPTGIQTNCASGTCSNESNTTPAGLGGDSSVTGSANQAFAALGSVNFTSGTKSMMNIVVQRPVVDSVNFETTTRIQVTGAYNSNGTLSGTPGTSAAFGLLAQITGGTSPNYTTTNYTSYGGSNFVVALHARGGDADLDGTVGFSDYSPVSNNYGQPGTWKWNEGDFTGDGAVGFDDYSFVSNHFNDATYNYTVYVSPSPGSGSIQGGVPEPASIALVGLALIGGMGLCGRKR
jgi:hypothetical protein